MRRGPGPGGTRSAKGRPTRNPRPASGSHRGRPGSEAPRRPREQSRESARGFATAGTCVLSPEASSSVLLDRKPSPSPGPKAADHVGGIHAEAPDRRSGEARLVPLGAHQDQLPITAGDTAAQAPLGNV